MGDNVKPPPPRMPICSFADVDSKDSASRLLGTWVGISPPHWVPLTATIAAQEMRTRPPNIRVLDGTLLHYCPYLQLNCIVLGMARYSRHVIMLFLFLI